MPQYSWVDRYTGSSQKSRQKPGAACEECRRRKLRCDRQQPRCGLCETSGVACLVSECRPSRGPKRGYLSSLQSRIGRFKVQLPHLPFVFFPTWRAPSPSHCLELIGISSVQRRSSRASDNRTTTQRLIPPPPPPPPSQARFRVPRILMPLVFRASPPSIRMA